MPWDELVGTVSISLRLETLQRKLCLFLPMLIDWTEND